MDRVAVTARIDHAPAAGVGLGKARIGDPHPLLERNALALEAVVAPVAGAGRAGVEVEQEREVGRETAGGPAVDAGYLIDPHPARRTLVGERRVEEAVRYDDAPVGERRPDHPRHELGPCRREQERFGLGSHQHVRLLDQLSDALADRGAARLANGHRRVAEGLAQKPRLRGLPGAVDSLDRHEQAVHGAKVTVGEAALVYDAAPMRALVTGGAGFIGSNLVDALLGRGDAVTVVDDLSTGRRTNLESAGTAGGELVESDVRDAAAMRALLKQVRPEVVYHLAAQVDVRRSTAEPAFDAAVNVGGTINVLDAARAAGVRRFVNTSSGGAIYGEAQTIPAPEEHPLAPESPYGQSKFAAEGYCDLFSRLHGLSVVSLRYGNVYGPRQDPLGEAGVVAIFCGRLFEGQRPTVFGDGLQTRDYVHVDDVVEANLAAAESAATGPLNIGTGVETSVLDLVEALRPAATASFEPDHEPERPGEVRHIALDASRARDELGWEPKTAVPQGLERTLESLRHRS